MNFIPAVIMNHLPRDKKAEFHKLVSTFIKNWILQIAFCQENDFEFKLTEPILVCLNCFEKYVKIICSHTETIPTYKSNLLITILSNLFFW